MTTVTISKPQVTSIPSEIFEAGMLDVYQFRILCQYWHEEDGSTLSARSLSRKTGVSVGKANQVRQELAELGLIRLEKQGNGLVVTLLLRSCGEQNRSQDEHQDKSGVHVVNGQSHAHTRARNNVNNNVNGVNNVDIDNNSNKAVSKGNKAGQRPALATLPNGNSAGGQISFAETASDWDALAEQSAAASKPPVRKRTERQEATASLSEYFLQITNLPPPPKNYPMLQKRWWQPLWYMYNELADNDMDRAKKLIKASVQQLREGGLTFDAPDSLTKTARHLYTQPEFGKRQMAVIS